MVIPNCKNKLRLVSSTAPSPIRQNQDPQYSGCLRIPPTDTISESERAKELPTAPTSTSSSLEQVGIFSQVYYYLPVHGGSAPLLVQIGFSSQKMPRNVHPISARSPCVASAPVSSPSHP